MTDIDQEKGFFSRHFPRLTKMTIGVIGALAILAGVATNITTIKNAIFGAPSAAEPQSPDAHQWPPVPINPHDIELMKACAVLQTKCPHGYAFFCDLSGSNNKEGIRLDGNTHVCFGLVALSNTHGPVVTVIPESKSP